jgi:hypothetical protein
MKVDHSLRSVSVDSVSWISSQKINKSVLDFFRGVKATNYVGELRYFFLVYVLNF